MNSTLKWTGLKRLSPDKIRIFIAVTVPVVLAVAVYAIDKREGFNGYYYSPMKWSLWLLFLSLLLPFPKKKALIFLEAAVVFFFCVKMTYVELEMFNGNNFDLPFDGEKMLKIRLYINWAIISAFFLGFISLFGNFYRGLMVSSVLLLILGFVSYVILEFRGDTFLPTDILAVRTAVDVSGSYRLEFKSNVFAALLLFLTQISMILRTRRIRYFPTKASRLTVRGITFCLVIWFICFFINWPFERYYYAWFVPNNGYMYSVAMNLKMFNIRPDESYSEEGVAASIEAAQGSKMLKKKYDPKKAIAEAFPDYKGKAPHIICIMNESFADLSQMGEVKTETDIMKNIHNMKKKTLQGNVVVEVFGGGTSDSEYSFLTGNSTKLFADNARAYEVYMKNKKASLTWNLRKAGYQTYALHPDKKENWNREDAYPLLGFEEFYSQDSFENPELVRDIYAADSVTYDKIEEIYENREEDPLFIFDVTLQNHGSYNIPYSNLDPVEMSKPDAELYPQAQQYLSLIKKSDEAFKELTDYFEDADEPVLILMFGDHFPRLDEGFYEELTGQQKDEWDLETNRKQHSTPFIFWANYELPKEKVGTLSINYLSTLLTELTGEGRSPYNDYLAGLYNKFPVIDRSGVLTPEGEAQYYDELPQEQEEIITEYDNVIYNNVFTESEESSLFGLKEKE